MKIILLAAGQSKRVKPIFDKCFVKICGKPLIEWQIRSLQKASFCEIVIVGNSENVEKLRQLQIDGSNLNVVEQKNLELGMLGALIAAKEEVIGEDAIFVVSSNDVIDNAMWQKVQDELRITNNESRNNGFLVGYKVSRYFPGGYLKVNQEGFVKNIIEKPGEGNEPSDLVNLVIHCHRNVKTLYQALGLIQSKNLSFEASQSEAKKDDFYERALQTLFDQGKKYAVIPYDGFWQAVKYPWHFLRLMEFYLGALSSHVATDAEIAKTAVIKGNVIIESGVKVLDYAVIQGPAYIGKGSIIGNHALVRESSLGEHCVVGHATEVARSLLQDDVWMHKNYIGDSVIGNNVAFGSGTVTGNLRLDEGEIGVCVNGEKINSRRKKLGIVTGDNIRIGINTSFMPGVKIGSNTMIGPGLSIGEDVEEGKFVKTPNDIRENTKKVLKRHELFQALPSSQYPATVRSVRQQRLARRSKVVTEARQ